MTTEKFSKRNLDPRLSSLYTSGGDKQKTYDRWAKNYEADLVNDMDYVAHIDVAQIFNQVFKDKNARILDVACGTGLVGAELGKLGFTQVDGTDFSSEMLKISVDRGVYQDVYQHDFTQPLDRKGQYDALICVGLFAFHEPKITDIIHVIQAVRPQSYCVISVNGAAWCELELETAVRSEAVKHGFCIEKIHKSRYIKREGINGRIMVIRSPEKFRIDE